MSKHNRLNELQSIEDNDRKLIASDDELFSMDNSGKLNNPNIKEPQSLITSQIIQEYPSKPLIPGGNNGFFIASIPVVISEFEVEINCETTIELDYPATEIKRVKKNVFITQCRLLPKPKKLFLKGFIRKNIEYASLKSRDSRNGSNIRHMTFEVPFICTTEVEYFSPPIVNDSNCCTEVEIFKSEPSEISVLEKSNESYEYFNEKICCQLIMARVSDMDIIEEGEKKNKTLDDKVFQSLLEKIALTLRIKLLQNQDINIYPKPTRSKKKNTETHLND